jgi:restriction system protein
VARRPYRHRYYKKSRRGADIPLPVFLVLPVAAVLFLGVGQFSIEQLVIAISLIAAVVVAVVGSIAWWQWSRARQRQRALQLVDIDRMDGHVFEHYVADLLRWQGYTQVSVTPQNNDFGVDILFTDPTELNSITTKPTTYAAQVKRYRGFVGVEALYQASGGRDYYGCDRAAVITNSRFSIQAHQLAKKTGLLLIDRTTLADWIHGYSQQS